MNSIRPAISLITAFLAISLGLSSCMTMQHCKPETLPLPAESNFVKIESTSHGDKYPFWQTKSAGKPVLFLHAMNGISPRTADLALELESWGYRVYLPSLYGTEVIGHNPYGFNQAIKANALTMVSPDWDTLSPDNAGQILDDIREMTRWISRRENKSDVIVIGNCLTGIFPLALIDEPHIQTVVLCQPATPIKTNTEIVLKIPQSKNLEVSLGIPHNQLEKSFAALENHPTKRIIGFHYLNDPLAPIEKFESLHDQMADRGLDSQFETYVMSPRKADLRGGTRWTEVEKTKQRRKLLVPHSTIINPELPEDREWFRSHLQSAISVEKG